MSVFVPKVNFALSPFTPLKVYVYVCMCVCVLSKARSNDEKFFVPS